ncbi:MAG: hypothetical protein HDT22_06745 [Ruminococcus sp.]|nr:hypothetical protein [Ruminococcus sp.]
MEKIEEIEAMGKEMYCTCTKKERAYQKAKNKIFKPFCKLAEEELNINLSQILNSCYDSDSENFEINLIENFSPVRSKVNKLAEIKYIESFSDNPDTVLQDIQTILNEIEKQDFIEEFFKGLLEIKQDEITSKLENAYNCVLFLFFNIGLQLIVTKKYENHEKTFNLIKEKVLEWYPFPESEIATAFQYYANAILKKQIISVGAKKPDSILFPLDKVTQDIFNYIAVKSCKRTINVEKSGSNDELDTIITLDFSKLEESGNLTFKKLTPFEKRVYVACGALQEAGNEYISATQIYKQMGGKGRPAAYQIKKIIEACEGMSCTKIKIDNKEESEKYNYPRFREDLIYLFPAESVKNVEINGKTVEYCIHFLKDELPLFTFAKQRKQITAYTLEQWALPFSMTDDNLALDDYFRARIARMSRDNNKKKSYNEKILYTAIYKACVIDTPKKRSRATTKFRKLLDHYKKTGIIKDYQEKQDGITIIL